jgi:hypothetical protein
MAFASVEYIMRDVPLRLADPLHPLHRRLGMFFVVVYLHMFRGLIYGSYRQPRELIWMFGVLIYLVLMGEAFMGYLLPWGQMSYWGAQVIINLFAAVPFIGEDLSTLDSWRLRRRRRHPEPLLRLPRHRPASGAARPGGRPPGGAARSRLEQPGRRRDQEAEGRDGISRSTASHSTPTTRSRTSSASWSS